MIRILSAFLIVALGVLSYELFNLGMDWIYDGYGLHPMLAWPLCWLYICCTFHIFKQFLLTFKPVAQLFEAIEKMEAAPFNDGKWEAHDYVRFSAEAKAQRKEA